MKGGIAMSIEANKSLIRRVFAIFNKEDESPLSEFLAPDLSIHEPDDGIQGVAGVNLLRTAFPDVKYKIEGDLIAEGDMVVSRWTARGTHRGELFGRPPTGRQVSWTGITIWRIANDKIAEAWVNRDTLNLLKQVGALPLQT